jgi:2-polyprenyl-6-methoxyphenol hydroxylase-like FAD-dependent oxidoreductase
MRVVICGAGIAGLAIAQRLATHHWEVHLVELAPAPRKQGYMIDFFGLGYDAAEAMGVLPRLKQLAYPVSEAAFIDTKGRRRAAINYARFARALDGRLLDLMRPDLEVALREQVANSVHVHFGCSPTAIDNTDAGVRVALSDGSCIDADLLIGADGIHSSVRRLIFGPERQFFRYLGFHTAAFTLDDPWMYARLKGRFSITDSTERMLGFYGLRGGRVAVFAVHRTSDARLPADTRLAVRQVYGSLGWLVPRALEQCPPATELYYDQVAQIVVPEWTRGRVTLLGDAGYAVSLLAGQGASLAIAGAYLLGEQLAAAPSMEVALARYQQIWQPFVTDKQRVGRRGAEWFLPSSAAQLWLRRIAVALGGLPGLDRLFGTALVGKSNVRIDNLTRGQPYLPTAAH